jgi:hypothetical protein
MAELTVIVPSRGRPAAAAELTGAFAKTCTADTELVLAVDDDDPFAEDYGAVPGLMYGEGWPGNVRVSVCRVEAPSSMVKALNATARALLTMFKPDPVALGFMGDDHRPRTLGWDRAYLDALAAVPGLVYGNDLLQGPDLPTQVAMTADLVRTLGHMAPPTLTHMYVDNYWKRLGADSGMITYLPDIIVEHRHPAAGKAAWDDGYMRVNSKEMFARDEAAIEKYWTEFGARDVARARQAVLA